MEKQGSVCLHYVSRTNNGQLFTEFINLGQILFINLLFLIVFQI